MVFGLLENYKEVRAMFNFILDEVKKEIKDSFSLKTHLPRQKQEGIRYDTIYRKVSKNELIHFIINNHGEATLRRLTERGF